MTTVPGDASSAARTACPESMRRRDRGARTSAPPPPIPVRCLPLFLAAVALFLLGACASFREPLPHAPPPPPDVEAPVPDGPAPNPARTLYIIDGDADYLYHDAAGNRLRADDVALQEAREAARAAVHGEVFIFHQRTGFMRKLWGGRTGRFEHYRFGHLVSRARYARDTTGLNAEAAALRHAEPGGSLNAPLSLAYFGHEILVEDARTGSLTITEFARGLERIAHALGREDDTPYDVIVLSTCYGGTPDMMRALAPLAEYAVASPAYLHLSYLDAGLLATSPVRPHPPETRREEARREDAQRLADSVAAVSFDRLRTRTSTEITVAVYDLGTVMPPPFPSVARVDSAPRLRRDAWGDCARIHAAPRAADGDRGVVLRYQPPRFGPRKHVTTRSGWQCLVRDARDASPDRPAATLPAISETTGPPGTQGIQPSNLSGTSGTRHVP